MGLNWVYWTPMSGSYVLVGSKVDEGHTVWAELYSWIEVYRVKVTQQAAKWSNESKYSKLKKTIEIQIVRLTEVCGKLLSEKNA